jgi:hypothetical protein
MGWLMELLDTVRDFLGIGTDTDAPFAGVRTDSGSATKRETHSIEARWRPVPPGRGEF